MYSNFSKISKIFFFFLILLLWVCYFQHPRNFVGDENNKPIEEESKKRRRFHSLRNLYVFSIWGEAALFLYFFFFGSRFSIVFSHFSIRILFICPHQPSIFEISWYGGCFLYFSLYVLHLSSLVTYKYLL